MTYLNTDIYTTKHKQNLYNIEITDYDNDEIVKLDITEKEIKILYKILKKIIIYNKFPRTEIYENPYIDTLDCETWRDENE